MFASIVFGAWSKKIFNDNILGFIEQCAERLLVLNIIEASNQEGLVGSSLPTVYNKIMNSPHKANVVNFPVRVKKILIDNTP